MKKTTFYNFKLIGSFAISIFGITQPSFAAILPSESEMKLKLVSVLDESRIEAEFYPHLLSHAGAKMSPQQVAEMFNQATEQFLSKMSRNESNMVRVQLIPYIKPFITILLDEYPQEAVEAIQIFTAEQL